MEKKIPYTYEEYRELLGTSTKFAKIRHPQMVNALQNFIPPVME